MHSKNIKTIYNEPFMRVSKRADSSTKQTLVLYIFSLLSSILVGGIFIFIIGENPFVFYSTIILGCFKSSIAIKGLIRIIVPLLITSLGVTLAFKMRFWNIGAEGQLIMGAIFASYFALFVNGLPHWLLLIVMFIAGAVGGGIWGLIPAFFKSKFGTNETLLTLMMNYIALYIIKFLAEGPWIDPASLGFPKIAKFPLQARLDMLFGLNMGWIVAILLVVIIYIYIKYTKQGYEIAVVGESENTARYAGMSVNKVVMRTMFFSAAICGIAGMLQVSSEATSYTLSSGIASGVGFTAIIVAWLARLNPIGILIVSVLFGILEKGCGVAESSFGLSSSVSEILQGIILFVILGFDFFIRYTLVFRKKHNRIKEAVNDNETTEAGK